MDNITWMGEFDQRQQAEIRFSQVYAADFGHGTDGHNAKLIIAKMAQVLDKYSNELQRQQAEIDEMRRERDAPRG